MIGRTVWLASYPKSGNTWFRAVYTALTADHSADRLDPNRLTTDMIASARARLDSALGIVSSLLRPDESDTMREIADEVLDRPMNERDTAVHLCKIHDAYRTLPGTGSAIVSTRATRHAIYIVRDPRDVAVSLAHHDGITPAKAVCRLADPDAMLGRHRDGVDRQLRQVTGSWSDHVLSWVDDAPFPVHVVRYEDALDESHTVVEQAETTEVAGHLCRRHGGRAHVVGRDRAEWHTPRLDRTSVSATRLGSPDEVQDYSTVNATEEGPSVN